MTASEHLLVVTRAWIEKTVFTAKAAMSQLRLEIARSMSGQTAEMTIVSADRARPRANRARIAKELEKALKQDTKSEK